MTEETLRLVADMIDYAEDTRSWVEGMGRDAFVANERLFRAARHNILAMGGLADRLPADFRDRHPEIPWRPLAGLERLLRDASEPSARATVWDIIELYFGTIVADLRSVAIAIEATLWPGENRDLATTG